MFVSHDRYFIDNSPLAFFEIESGKLHDYPGNYEDYLWQKDGARQRPYGFAPNHEWLRTNCDSKSGCPPGTGPKNRIPLPFAK